MKTKLYFIVQGKQQHLYFFLKYFETNNLMILFVFFAMIFVTIFLISIFFILSRKHCRKQHSFYTSTPWENTKLTWKTIIRIVFESGRLNRNCAIFIAEVFISSYMYNQYTNHI